MARIVDIVTQAIAPHIKAPYELVDVVYGKMGGDALLSIFVDKEGGISLNDTAELSEVISPLLDQIQPVPFPEQYMLEVTSPGLERPLKTAEAVEKAVGKYVHVKLYQAIDQQKVFEGTLLSFQDQELRIEYMDKTRKKQVTIPYQAVATARLAVKL